MLAMRLVTLVVVMLIVGVVALVTGHGRELVGALSLVGSGAMLGMPFYYDVKKVVTTNGTANTLSTHFRFLTVANQMVARFMGLYGAARFGTAGGAVLKLIRAGTAGTGGTSQTPAKRNPNARAADTTALDDATTITAGATPVTHLSVGVAQTGGMGGWVALEQDHAPAMLPNGGANGNMEIGSLANSASVTVEVTAEFQEN